MRLRRRRPRRQRRADTRQGHRVQRQQACPRWACRRVRRRAGVAGGRRGHVRWHQAQLGVSDRAQVRHRSVSTDAATHPSPRASVTAITAVAAATAALASRPAAAAQRASVTDDAAAAATATQPAASPVHPAPTATPAQGRLATCPCLAVVVVGGHSTPVGIVSLHRHHVFALDCSCSRWWQLVAARTDRHVGAPRADRPGRRRVRPRRAPLLLRTTTREQGRRQQGSVGDGSATTDGETDGDLHRDQRWRRADEGRAQHERRQELQAAAPTPQATLGDARTSDAHQWI